MLYMRPDTAMAVNRYIISFYALVAVSILKLRLKIALLAEMQCFRSAAIVAA